MCVYRIIIGHLWFSSHFSRLQDLENLIHEVRLSVNRKEIVKVYIWNAWFHINYLWNASLQVGCQGKKCLWGGVVGIRTWVLTRSQLWKTNMQTLEKNSKQSKPQRRRPWGRAKLSVYEKSKDGPCVCKLVSKGQSGKSCVRRWREAVAL